MRTHLEVTSGSSFYNGEGMNSAYNLNELRCWTTSSNGKVAPGFCEIGTECPVKKLQDPGPVEIVT